MDIDDEAEKPDNSRVYIPHRNALGQDEVLEADQSAYELLHSMSVMWPCLSFDILWDSLGDERQKYPATCYIAAGTQADIPKNNELMIMKMSQLHKTQHDNDDESGSDDDDDALDEDPILEHRSIKHFGGVNRVRALPQRNVKQTVATWSDTGKVHIWDVSADVTALDTPGYTIPKGTRDPIFTIPHRGEGFAIDWSRTVTGMLASGDIHSNIYVTSASNTSYRTDKTPYTSHTSSIEDLQWSPVEKTVFASCSADKSIRIWDTRKKQHVPALTLAGAHDADVNVISWNTKVSSLIASGGDEGGLKVWDLRTWKKDGSEKPTPVASFNWHKAPITSVEWHPTEESVLGASGADDQVTLWDLSVEEDAEEQGGAKPEGLEDVPPQLLFVHQGQTDIKEIHWHKQIPGCMVSTAGSGFNVFKTISV